MLVVVVSVASKVDAKRKTRCRRAW